MASSMWFYSIFVAIVAWQFCIVMAYDQYTCPYCTWKCKNRYGSIRQWDRCNGRRECSDSSDEQNCDEWRCTPERRKCRNNKCAWQDYFCDGKDDCGDNSDEENCDQWECPADFMWRCKNSRKCVWFDFRCDGKRHCSDGSDEANCDQWQCPSNTWKCESSRHCIWKNRRCDGTRDCRDRSDEKNCEEWTCPTDTWRCDNNRCVNTNRRCDGSNNCGDNSDERNCQLWTCPRGYWQCTNKQCIPQQGRCDGYSLGHLDCVDGSDEQNCGPCGNYTVLDDVARDVNNGGGTLCDRNLPFGWYRFRLNNADAVMPTSCVPSSHCGTRSPYWLDLQGGKLPAVGQEKAARACAQHWWSCHWFRTPITVRNCGAFYLYKLEAPKDCDLAYCAKTV